MSYSIWTLLANPEAAQKAVLASYLNTMANDKAVESRELEFAPVLDRTRIIELRLERNDLRFLAAELTR